ncbi:MAG: hypothetical protein AAEJ04_08725 [Planctomycetota bacterium]
MLYCDECGTISDKNYGPEDGSVRCPRCAGATEEAPATSGLSLLDEPSSLQGTGFNSANTEMSDLDLFSSDTIAQKRKPKKADGETRLRLIEEPVENNSADQDRPAIIPQQPEQWRFECLACSGSLSVSPVSCRSKICCPRCQSWMVIGPEGEVHLPSSTPKIHSASHQTFSEQVPTPFEASNSTVDQSTNDAEIDETSNFPPQISTPSAAALQAADSVELATTETITIAPPAIAPALIEETDNSGTMTIQDEEFTGPIEDALGFLGDDPHQFGTEFDLDPEPETPPAEISGETTELTRAMMVAWTGLFTVPTLTALLIARLAPSTEIYQLFSRIGLSVQHSCGDFLTYLSAGIMGL